MSAASPVRLGIVGCGDVIFRSYIPGLLPIADTVQVVALCDHDLPRAEAAARSLGSLAANACCYADQDALFDQANAEAILNLTPAPIHGEVTAAALAAGLHVYSEKPLARTIDEASALIASARERGLLLLCAPAVMATRRYRWRVYPSDEGIVGFVAGGFGGQLICVWPELDLVLITTAHEFSSTRYTNEWSHMRRLIRDVILPAALGDGNRAP